MTLADFLPRAVHRGRVVSNVAVIDIPDVVRTTNMHRADQQGIPLEVHDIGSDGRHTKCMVGLAGLDTPATADVRTRDGLKWCEECWPTDRYCHCGAPSGQATECTLCDRVDLDADKRIEAGS